MVKHFDLPLYTCPYQPEEIRSAKKTRDSALFPSQNCKSGKSRAGGAPKPRNLRRLVLSRSSNVVNSRQDEFKSQVQFRPRRRRRNGISNLCWTRVDIQVQK